MGSTSYPSTIRQESEGRSHAFNSRIGADGSGVFGLPTVFKQECWSDYTDGSNVHFFAVDPSLDIRPSGYLGAPSSSRACRSTAESPRFSAWA